MKYLPLEAEFNKVPACIVNMEEALFRLGQINPHNISPRKACWDLASIESNRIPRYKLIKMGILNVKKTLNGHLGKSGKYTTKMISQTAHIRTTQKENGVWILSTRIPAREFIAIVVKIYLELWTYDKSYCYKLLNIESHDNYPGQKLFDEIAMKVIAPIQANIIFLTKGRTQYVESSLKRIRITIMRG